MPQPVAMAAPISSHANDYRTALDEFNNLRESFTLTNFKNQRFVLVDPLIAKLRQKSSSCQYRDDLHRLVASSHLRRSPNPPLSLEQLVSEYCRVFFILLAIGHDNLIDVFHHRNLCDANLPINQDSLKNDIERIATAARLRDDVRYELFDKFYQEQFAWCPMIVEQDKRDVNPNKIMPFLTQTEIQPQYLGGGGQSGAKLFMIEVPEGLIGPALSKKLDPDLFFKKVDEDDMPINSATRYYKFALKQFSKDLEASFHRENRAFINFGVQEGMIRYIGCCEDTDSTNSIILELGDCDLYTTIRNELPPVSSLEINAFWFAMSGVAKALAQIHKLIKDNMEYDVWLADVKPENILRVGARFKLADPGEARFVIAQNTAGPSGTVIAGGTRTYAAPEKAPYLEHLNALPEKILPNSDVWSLGCVFSIAATYVVLGTQGVLQFDEVRRLDEVRRRQNANSSRSPQQRNWPDAFYDGGEVRKVVTEWHTYLRQAARGTDRLTAEILDLIDKHVLVPQDRRWNADRFSSGLETLINDLSISEVESEVPSEIEELLQEIDPKAISERERSDDGSRVENGSSQRLSMRHRQSRHDSDSPHPITVGKILGERIKPTAQRSQPRSPTGTDKQVTSSMSLHRVQTGSSTSTSRTSGHYPVLQVNTDLEYGSIPQRPPTMTMWQLDRMLQKHKKHGKSLRDFRHWGHKRPASVKGQLSDGDQLEKYYRNRDIVWLIDNGSSMLPHWGEAFYLLRTLVWRSLGYDDDGMELYFTNPDTKERVRQNKNQDVSKFEQAMNAAEPSPDRNVATNLCPKLTEIINEYVTHSPAAQKPKPKTIIVLTDGIWRGDLTDDGIREIIETNMRSLAGINRADVLSDLTPTSSALSELSKTRPFTIQFISFGHDEKGIDRMAALDDNSSQYPDLVDVEPSNGDVYKMFLGSLDDMWDNKVNTVNRPPLTPARSTSTSMRADTGSSRSRGVTPSTGSFFGEPLQTPATSPLGQDEFSAGKNGHTHRGISPMSPSAQRLSRRS